MAFFATGNQGWDQGLNTLAGSLFPDPSKQAQAGLYGAETAKTLLDAQRLRDEKGYRDQLADYYKLRAVNPGAAPPTPPPAPGTPPPLANTIAPLPTAPAPTASAVPGPMTGAAPAPTPAPMPAPPAPAPMPAPGAAPAPAAAPRAGAAPAAGGPMAGFSIPQLVALSTLSGNKSPETALMARSELVNRARTGQIPNDAMLNREQSALGDSTPLTEAGLTQRKAMDNATTLALPGATATANIRQNDATLTSVTLAGTGPGTGKPAVTRQVTVSEVKAHPELYSPQDSARIMQAETLQKTQTGGPNGPIVYTPTDQAAGMTVGDPELARQRSKLVELFRPDANNGAGGVVQSTEGAAPGSLAKSEGDLVLVVPNAGGTPASRSRAWLRAHPDHRELTAQEMQTVQSMGPKGPVNFPAVSTYGGAGGTVAAAGTDQQSARVMQQVTQLIAGGDAEGARKVIEGAQTAQMTLVPKQNITPEQAAKIKEGSDAYFANMYAPQSGTLGKAGASKLPAEADPDIATYHAALTAWLEDRAYKTNPAMAPIVAWDMMRADGIIPHDANEARNNVKWFAPTLGDPAITGDTEPRFRIKGDFSRVPRDASGQIILPGGGVRPGSPAGLPQGPRTMPTGPAAPPAPTAPPKSLVDTVAPQKTAAPVVDQGKPLGPAPGLPDGPFKDSTTGISYIVRGGQLYAAPAP